MEFDHTLEQVPEELRDNIRVGAVISGTCILSGDVAIKEYDKGIVRDFEHNLKLLRYTTIGERGLLLVDVDDEIIGPHRILLSIVESVTVTPDETLVTIKTEHSIYRLERIN